MSDVVSSAETSRKLWTASELRMECECFVDRLLPLSTPQGDFTKAVDGVFQAMRFLLGQPR